MNLAANWQALTLIAAIMTAGGVGALKYNDLEIQVAENTTARLIQTFERLENVRRHRRLSQIEWQKWCYAGRQLNVFQTCPPR